MNNVQLSLVASYDNPNVNSILSTTDSRKSNRATVTTSKDSVEISKVAYELQEEPKATSGQDELKVTKSSGKFVIHFDNSAILSRTVKRGYLEVNGHKLELSEDVKKKLLSTDKQVRKSNDRAFMFAMMEHEIAVARQQSDVFKKMGAKQNRTLQTASRIMQGKKVSQADEQELMRTAPDLYFMAKSAAMLKQQRQKHKVDEDISRHNDQARIQENQSQTYSVESIEYERSETQMTLSFDGAELEVHSIMPSTIEP